MMKKKFDAIALMRQARQKLEDKWKDKPRKEEIESLRNKYTNINIHKAKP